MRILHVITSLKTGGAEKLMVDLLPRMRDKGVEVDLCVFDGADTPFKRQLTESGINIISLGTQANVYHPAYLWKLWRLMRKGRYDIVHTHNTAPQLFAAIASVLCSVVLCTTEHNTSNRRRDWRWYVAVDRWMYSRYKSVVCISEKTKDRLQEYIGKCKTRIVTIHNGIDVEKYANAQPVNLKQTLPDCNFALIQVAGFRIQKDQDTVIKALKQLPPEVHLFLVGDGERRSELEVLTAQLELSPRIHFMGIRTDVASLLRGADIAIMSSHWEGFGLAAVEAMAAGIPVIASNVDGLAQVVQGAGVLFEHENSTQLAERITQQIENKETYNSLVNVGYTRAEQFSIDRMANEYIGEYQTILSSPISLRNKT